MAEYERLRIVLALSQAFIWIKFLFVFIWFKKKIVEENNVVSNSNSLGTYVSYARVVFGLFMFGERVQLISRRVDLFVKCQKPNNDNIENSWSSKEWEWVQERASICVRAKELFIKSRERASAIEHLKTGKWRRVYSLSFSLSIAWSARIVQKKNRGQLITLIFHCVGAKVWVCMKSF